LPICMYCKKLRDDTGSWLAAEAYVAARTSAQFALGECKSCLREQEQESSGVLESMPPAVTPVQLARGTLARRQRTLLGLMLVWVVILPLFFVALNVARGYWVPVPFQAGTAVLGLALLVAARRGLALDLALLGVLGLMVAWVTSVALATHDFLRVFPAWPLLMFLVCVAVERVRWAVAAMVVLLGLAVMLTLVVPGVGIPKQLLTTILVPTMTAIVAGFAVVSRRRLLEDLVQALAQVRELRGVLPFCVRCKKLRDDDGVWHQLEAYVVAHSDAHFSHGVCEDCAPRLEADLGISLRGKTAAKADDPAASASRPG
ncbi:MAG: hypothetical protein KC431_05870, partial [Myxococcales bacterium]|nr:hypothetical protein [Myxococcales bacterium]